MKASDFLDIVAGERIATSSALHSTSVLCFFKTRGPDGHSLGLQAGVLLLVASATHLFDPGQPLSRGMFQQKLRSGSQGGPASTCNPLSEFRRRFGGETGAWGDVDVGESAFDKKRIPIKQAESPNKKLGMVWEQWVRMSNTVSRHC